MSNKLISSNKNILIAGILILLIGIGILGYFWNKKEVNPNPLIFPSPTLTPPEEVWETYTNSELGFSIKYPKMVYGVYRCSPNKPFYVPLKVFEDNINETVYITEEYYYDDWDSKSQSNTGTCRKITYSLESLQSEEKNATFLDGTHYPGWKPFLGWKILTSNTKNNSELNKFIKDNYGSGCFAGKKNPWKYQEGVYEITIKGEDWGRADLGTTTCPWNYSNRILYAPGKNKAISVVLGQECGFGTDSSLQPYKCYDEEMINSFRFK